ncbi:MAG: non-canonical purine NTP pyrophosphatase [Sphaerochaeta sp.]
MRILLASSNEHKRHEFSQLFKNHEILLPKDSGIDFECEETGATFLENAIQKAYALFDRAHVLKIPVMADDSGLVVHALPGLLGVRTARFGAENGGPLLSAHDKNMLLISMLKGKPEYERKASFVCAIVLMLDRYRIYSAVESADGRILEEETGVNGFGYDPVFYCYEAQSPMALLPEGDKNLYSHRGKAAKALMKLIN